MPNYMFECKQCGIMDLNLKMKDSMLSTCPKCKSKEFKRIWAGGKFGIKVKGGTPIHYSKDKDKDKDKK